MTDEELQEILDKAKVWDQRYLEVNLRALEHCLDEQKFRETVRRFLQPFKIRTFAATNPYAKRIWLPEVISEYLKVSREKRGKSWDEALEDRDVACGFVTLTHRAWSCCDENLVFDLSRAKKKIRFALTGLDFIAVIEPAVYRNEFWETDGIEGNLISFHCHALVWARSRYKLKRRIKQISRLFQPSLGKKSAVRLQEVRSARSAAKCLVYEGKLPTLGYRTYKTRGGKTRQRHAAITHRSRYLLFQETKNYRIFDFWLAGGEGKQVLDRARLSLVRTRGPRAFKNRDTHHRSRGAIKSGHGSKHTQI